ncbi:MAG TPA: polysaccharide deacetylase family protein [Bradyrhizobium sp.]|uniref:polysaccharide deacetylase family protein n=1 Tax=Bradyrhizobium sp. TaxID=376 RepID=UPI002D7FF5B1|nr:polysaccharide deacetylase family protein [Bradyrhizobium sp.]HET7889597.1 polysaccharide deacetylase family protein [Bradyrhizobium sp.]
MKQLRSNVIRAGLEALYFTGAHRLFRPIFAGVGSIFMLHHVRPAPEAAFRPNSHLEITPKFLRTVLSHLRSHDVDIVTMDEVHRRLSERDFSRRFAAFTFDDGYRDNRDFALPVMREFDAPFTVYVASDFAQAQGNLWWVALEMVIAAASSLEIPIDGVTTRIDTSTLSAKSVAFERVHNWLRALPGRDDLDREIGELCSRHGIDRRKICSDLCMSWDELKGFAGEALVSIGAHSITHCNIAKQTDEMASEEMTRSRSRIEDVLQRPVLHFAYPYGDRHAAGPREFALAKRCGFKTAVTTRPGMIFPESAEHPTALPRLSLNGNFQQERILPVLTSGAATAMWNGFRRVDAA